MSSQTPQVAVVDALGAISWRSMTSNALSANDVKRFQLISRAKVRFDFVRTSGTVVIDVWRP